VAIRAGQYRRVWRCGQGSLDLAIPPVPSPGLAVSALAAVAIAYRRVRWWDPANCGWLAPGSGKLDSGIKTTRWKPLGRADARAVGLPIVGIAVARG